MKEEPNYYAIIPANIRYDEDLIQGAKLLYGEITALSNQKGFCWANDMYFANLYKVSKKTIQTWLKSLEVRGYLTREVIYKEGSNEIVSRYIRLCAYPSNENVHTPMHEKVRDNNTSINTTINNTSNKKILSSSDEQDAPSKKSRKKVYEENSPYYQLALLLIQEINKNGPINTPNLQTWSDDIRKLVELDKKEIKLVEQIIVWSQASDFWSKNILSATKLRKQFDMLVRQSGLSKPQVSQEEKDYGWE